MPVVRGPDGKFQSVDEYDDADWRTYVGSISYVVPAADLGGGTADVGQIQGDETELIDFNADLHSDETFHVAWGHFQAILGPHTTATAEGWARAGVEFSRNGSQSDAKSAFLATNYEEDVFDVNRSRIGETTGTLHRSQLHAEPSHSDTANGLAGGSDYDRDRALIPFGEWGRMPAFDADDEVYAPTAIDADNISDHAIEVRAEVELHGPVVDDDHC